MNEYDKLFVPMPDGTTVKEAGSSFFLEKADGETTQLPLSQTTLTKCGIKLTGVTVPRWLAEKEGMIEPTSIPSKKEEDEQMTRYDWFLLGTTMAMLGRQSYTADRETVWDARKVADQLINLTQERSDRDE